MSSTSAVAVSIQAVSPLAGCGTSAACASTGASASSVTSVIPRRGAVRTVLGMLSPSAGVFFISFAPQTPTRTFGPGAGKLGKCAQRVQIPCHRRVERGFRRLGLARRSRPHHPGASALTAASLRGVGRKATTMDSFRIDEIARRLLERVPPALRSVQADLESNFRAVLRERLSKLDLVNRDEFDAQARVLERTRARLEALEARLAALEAGTSAAPPGGPASD